MTIKLIQGKQSCLIPKHILMFFISLAFRTFGESLVDILGITKPKYEYELNLARQMQEEDLQRQQKIDQLYSSWQSPSSSQVQMPGPPSSSVATLNIESNPAMESAPVIPNALQYPMAPAMIPSPQVPQSFAPFQVSPIAPMQHLPPQPTTDVPLQSPVPQSPPMQYPPGNLPVQSFPRQ